VSSPDIPDLSPLWQRGEGGDFTMPRILVEKVNVKKEMTNSGLGKFRNALEPSFHADRSDAVERILTIIRWNRPP
jgi:hypothetical protein